MILPAFIVYKHIQHAQFQAIRVMSLNTELKRCALLAGPAHLTSPDPSGHRVLYAENEVVVTLTEFALGRSVSWSVNILVISQFSDSLPGPASFLW